MPRYNSDLGSAECYFTSMLKIVLSGELGIWHLEQIHLRTTIMSIASYQIVDHCRLDTLASYSSSAFFFCSVERARLMTNEGSTVVIEDFVLYSVLLFG